MADRQVSERDAWTVGVERVTPSVHRIPIRMPTDALKAVNVYAVHGADGLGLVDGGWFIPGALQELSQGLATFGADLRDVSCVLVTHYHPDHYTLAVEIGRVVGCRVLLGAAESDTLDAIMAEERGLDDFGTSLRRSGVPQDLVRRHLHSKADSAHYGPPSEWLNHGDRPVVGGFELEALATPGHTRGHFCFYHEADDVLFTGDHVLPTITPAIGHESVASRLPLADFLDSLRMLQARRDVRYLPAHGPVAPSTHARVAELLAHHDERLTRCAEAVEGGAQTAYDVALRLPWTRRERHFTQLQEFDQLMAVHETRAHLDVLALRGVVEVIARDAVDEYVAA